MLLLAGAASRRFVFQYVALATLFSPVSSFHSTPNSMSFITERDGSGTITVSPRNEADQSGLVVISHGLGDTSEGFVDVAEFLAKELPHLKFILPTAPTQPVTMNMGMPMPSWYDITGLDERANENCRGLEESQAKIQSILEAEHASTGLPLSRMVLAGFSQGGALSLFTGLQYPERLAGIGVMSGYLPAAKKLQKVSNANKETPIWHGHGTDDPMVTLAVAQKSRDMVLSKGATRYELKTYSGLQHSVSTTEIGELKEFLQSVLPPDETCKVQLKDPSELSVKELKAAIRKAGLGSKAVGLMEKGEFVRLLKEHRDGSS